MYAHAEASSFNGALFPTAQETLRAAGHTVIISDLYAMKFDPVSDRRNLTAIKNPDFFKQQMLASLEYCARHGIGAFRVNSQILPLKTHPQTGYDIAGKRRQDFHAVGLVAGLRRHWRAAGL